MWGPWDLENLLHTEALVAHLGKKSSSRSLKETYLNGVGQKKIIPYFASSRSAPPSVLQNHMGSRERRKKRQVSGLKTCLSAFHDFSLR